MMECKHALAVGYSNGIKFIRTSDFDVSKTFWDLYLNMDAEFFDFCPMCGEDLSELWEALNEGEYNELF